VSLYIVLLSTKIKIEKSCIVYCYVIVLTFANKVNKKNFYKEAVNYLKMGDISNYSKKSEIKNL
jgi:hypothetical protein